jgi:membrane protease YdiL (CAAX protease family)
MQVQSAVRRHPVVTYFSLVFLISYGSFALLDGSKVLHGQVVPAADAEYVLFPVIVLGVCVVGLALTAMLDGRRGLRDVAARIGRWRVGVRWYAVALLTPPTVMVAVLLAMRTAVSPVFTPNIWIFGVLFGLPAFLEEIGWMGFAFPQMQRRQSAIAAAIVLGILWGLWHAPVVDYLGAAAPHGAYWLPFFLAFIAILTAMRVLIVWVYRNTGGSLLLAQLMHISMSGSLVMLDPAQVSPGQEALWYGVYAAALWVLVALVVWRYGKQLVRERERDVIEATPPQSAYA